MPPADAAPLPAFPGMPRRVLVTGAAGVFGGALVRRLLALPGVEQVVAFDIRPPPGPPADARLRPVVADLRRPPEDLLAGIDAVAHFAFRLRPSHDAAADRALNVEATAALLDACTSAGVRHFVYSSSAVVYGAQPGPAVPHPETDPLDPVPGFRYGEHKVEVERLLAAFAAAHPATSVTVLRPCVVLAPGAANFVTDLLALRWLPVTAGDDPEMQFLHIDDLVTAVLGILERRAAGAFNLAGEGTIRWREVIRLGGSRPLPFPPRLLAGLANLTWRARLQSRSPAGGLEMIRYPWLADTSRARTLLGWQPRYSSRRVVEAWREGEPGAGIPGDNPDTAGRRPDAGSPRER